MAASSSFPHRPPRMAVDAFTRAAGGGAALAPHHFASFLRSFQGWSSVSDQQAAAIFWSASSGEQLLHLPAFMAYLLHPQHNAAMVVDEAPRHDMNAPLSHYYICTSHNSYLRGNQLTSKCCTSPIISALRNGCRVIELDCWERRGKVMVLHGGTLTKPIPFEDCVAAIKEHAFVASEYPVIVTIENHLPPKLQQTAAKILKDVLQDMLYIPAAAEAAAAAGQTPPYEFCSPWQLRRKVIISDKPPEQRLTKQVADDPQGAVDAAPPSKLDSSGSSDDFSDEEDEKAARNKKRMARRVKQAADAMAQHRLLEEEEACSAPKVPELHQLLYIYCAKPSEMAYASADGRLSADATQGAIMANLSEAQLKKSAAAHPASLIRYTRSNLGRMYPFGLRVDSSNADPMLAWSHGFQLAAVNLQGKDRPCWIAHAFFRANAGCGYVRKPDCFLRGGDDEGEVNSSIVDHGKPRQLLKVRVLMGTDWHKRFDLFSKPDFYVKVAVHGTSADKLKRKTSVAKKCEEPNWEDQELVFPLRVPEIAVLRFEVWEQDRLRRDDFVGQACMPVTELRTGIRVVQLHGKSGVPKSSKLLCHFTLESTSRAD